MPINLALPLTHSLMILTGLLTGIVAGVFGLGGGIILIPILVLIFGMQQQTASGVSLVALLLPVGLLGAMAYFRAGKIGPEHVKYGLWIAIGLFLGTYIGARIAVVLPELWVRKGFALLLVAVAAKMWFR